MYTKSSKPNDTFLQIKKDPNEGAFFTGNLFIAIQYLQLQP